MPRKYIKDQQPAWGEEDHGEEDRRRRANEAFIARMREAIDAGAEAVAEVRLQEVTE